MKPYLGQIVEYRYKPESEPVAAMVAKIHDDAWVALWTFNELQRWLPHVEFAVKCKPALPPPAPQLPVDPIDWPVDWGGSP